MSRNTVIDGIIIIALSDSLTGLRFQYSLSLNYDTSFEIIWCIFFELWSLQSTSSIKFAFSVDGDCQGDI